ncbi:hypothetical protein GGR21_000026 [Dysgonomonas hofstadii]|uniref:Uncharacterized protein n=1 Tax=Dysgonomonas hofstadii TaxID=637886 RepID=A0A840CG02_9BACT|nr:hypothetical protein [Dysgonomonas hofstadii]
MIQLKIFTIFLTEIVPNAQPNVKNRLNIKLESFAIIGNTSSFISL